MIKITDKLTATQHAKLRRQAKFYTETDNTYDRAYRRVGRALYEPLGSLPPSVTEHDIARHMMVSAGVTFNYEIVKAAR
jgi:hypothetical protein